METYNLMMGTCHIRRYCWCIESPSRIVCFSNVQFLEDLLGREVESLF